MQRLLIFSTDQIFIKALSGFFRSRGYEVESVSRTALAVQRAISESFGIVILDSEAIGLSAADAAEALLKACEDTRVIIAGEVRRVLGAEHIAKPVDMEEVARLFNRTYKPGIKS